METLTVVRSKIEKAGLECYGRNARQPQTKPRMASRTSESVAVSCIKRDRLGGYGITNWNDTEPKVGSAPGWPRRCSPESITNSGPPAIHDVAINIWVLLGKTS